MRANFDQALAAVLRHEGGYVNHPRDPGGATNRGVTQAVYDDWRKRQGMDPRSVKSITDVELAAIYKRDYWDKVRGDEMPAGLDYCLFDFAVNSGASRAARYLQSALGVAADGQIGPATLAAVKALDRDVIGGKAGLIDQVCDARLAFLKRLPIFDTFGKGWTRRVEDVRIKSKAMA